jgi:preprotein translocase subunit SecY
MIIDSNFSKSYKENLKQKTFGFLDNLPDVNRSPEFLNFRKKLFYTFLNLVLYCIITSIPIRNVENITQFRNFNTLRTDNNCIGMLGRSTKFTADFYMVILMKINALDLQFGFRKSKIKKEKWTLFLAYLILILQSFNKTTTIFMTPNDNWVVSDYNWINKLMVFTQLYIGGILVILLESMCNKYGYGYGLSYYFLIDFSRSFLNWCKNLDLLELELDFKLIYCILYTISVLLICIFFYERAITKKLVHQNIRGVSQDLDLKYLYCETYPLYFLEIIKDASLKIIDIFSNIIGKNYTKFLRDFLESKDSFYTLYRNQQMSILVTQIIYTIVGISVSSYIWVYFTGLGDPQSKAQEILSHNYTIEGVRPERYTLTKYLKHYVDELLLSSIFLLIGLTFFSNLYPLLGGLNGSSILILLNQVTQLKNTVKRQKSATIGKLLYKIHTKI